MRKLKLALIAILIVIVSIVLGNYVLLNDVKTVSIFEFLKEKEVCIVSDIVVTQGLAESGKEKVKVTGTIQNFGDKEAKNLAVTVIFIDEVHNRFVRKPIIKNSAQDSLLPNESININEVYFRDLTIPKTEVKVKVKVEWIENGRKKVKIFPSVVSGKYS